MTIIRLETRETRVAKLTAKLTLEKATQLDILFSYYRGGTVERLSRKASQLTQNTMCIQVCNALDFVKC